MPRYSLFGKKESQEPAAPAQPVSPAQPPAQEQVLVLPRDDAASPPPAQAPPQPMPTFQPPAPEPAPRPLPPASEQFEYDSLLAWVSRLTTEQIKKYFTEEGIKEVLRHLAEERNNPVAKLALAVCGSSRQ